MTRLRMLTAGESHGPELTGILEGMPAGLKLDRDAIDRELARRQKGFGRSGRMQIETDRADIRSGVRFGVTLGSPITVAVMNRDWENWQERMAVWDGRDDTPVTIPRPGHADLAGYLKFGHQNLRNVLERASARETAVRVALGAIVRQLLDRFGVWIGSHVIQIHAEKTEKTFLSCCDGEANTWADTIRALHDRAEASDLRCGDPDAAERMREAISRAQADGDTVGGVIEVTALGAPPGLGSYVFWDTRMDARIAAAFMSIPGIKAVDIGDGWNNAGQLGSQVHDPIMPGSKSKPARTSDHAGGIEGGITNGTPVIVRAAMKPIPTLTRPLPSVDLKTGESVSAHKERSDVCAVPAVSVVGEAMLALVLADAFCERFGGDSVDQMINHFRTHAKTD